MERADIEPVVVNLIEDEDLTHEAPEDPVANKSVINLDDSEAPANESADNEDTGNGEENGEKNGERNVGEEGEPLVEEEDNPFADDEDSDEEGGGVQVTIRKMEQAEKPAARQGKLDLDSTAMISEKPIYDLDLAQMEDRPWRKPGADITDYFNYGFTEETWNLYCERQKKLRAEFSGNQKAANEALFSSIKISNPLANPVINQSSSVIKVLTDNGGRFKQSAYHQPAPTPSTSTIQNEQVIRTVISGNNQSAPSLMDFTRPPPGMSMPPMGMATPIPTIAPTTVADPILEDAPPGVDSTSDLPPGVESAQVTTAPPHLAGGLDLNLGLPPLGFNPNLPPPGMPPMSLMSTNLPPPGFSMPPPQFQQHSRAGFGPGPVGGAAPRSLLGQGTFSTVSDDDDERRASRRKRSRSRSPHRDRDRDRDHRRDRDSKRRSDRDSDRRRRDRSRSTSGDRRRRRDDREREKRRERRDDDDRKKRSRRDEDEESSGRKERREKRASSRSRVQEDEEADAGPVEVIEESPIVE